jgi:hypothetical protein
MEGPPTKHLEQSDSAACRRFWAAYLRRAADDFLYLRRGGVEVPTDGQRMSPAERARIWCELYTFFFDRDVPDEVGSLSWVCSVIGINGSRVRERLWQQLGDDIQLRRRRLTTSERAAILQLLKKGRTTTELGGHFKVDVSVVRKHDYV